MHPGAFEFVSRYATNEAVSVIEIGSRDINGSIRCHFPAATWTGIDLSPGPSVDVVGNAADYSPATPVDMVICCEVFEHTPDWRRLVSAAAEWLKPNGKLIITCAGAGRDPHSAVDGGDLKDGEWYRNLSEEELQEAMIDAGLRLEVTEVNEYWHDVYAVGTKT